MLDQAERQRSGDDLRGRDGVGSAHITPYVLLSTGQWTVPDHVLAALWDEMDRDATLGSIRSPVLQDAGDWVRFLQDRNIFAVIAGVVLNEALYPAGVCWLSHVGKGHASAHFTFLKRFWGRTDMLARAVLAYWDGMRADDGSPSLRVIIGGTPAGNRLACAFVKRVGFTVLGEIPYLADGESVMLSYRVHPELEANDGR